MRVKGLVVAFEEDVREEDAERVAELIRHVRGVAGVTASESVPDDWFALTRLRAHLLQRVIDVFDGK